MFAARFELPNFRFNKGQNKTFVNKVTTATYSAVENRLC